MGSNGMWESKHMTENPVSEMDDELTPETNVSTKRPGGVAGDPTVGTTWDIPTEPIAAVIRQ